MNTSLYHVIIYVPVSHADVIRKVLADAGAGKIGAYDSCSFSALGTGRFRPLKGAHPSIGMEDQLEEVPEERIEVVVTSTTIREVMAAVKRAHPYEEPAIHVIPMLDYHEFL